MDAKTDLIRVNLAACGILFALYPDNFDLNLSTIKSYAVDLFFPGRIRGCPK
jgi:hypothetical protein